MKSLRRYIVYPSAVLVISFAAFTACDFLDSLVDPSDPDIDEVIASVTANGVSATLHSGEPDSDGAAPAASVSGPASIIPGGGSRFVVSASSGYTVVFIFVSGREGYYRLNLGSQQTVTELILTLAEVLDAQYQLQFAVGSASGAGTWAMAPVQVVQVATGAVQVSVSWDVPSDVDLHLVEPSGEEIYYGNRTSASGGVLDLDSNAGCGGSDVRNENITWPDSSPPRGEYTVRVNYWSSCGQSATNYVVTVRVAGQSTRTFQGQFTGTGTGGGLGAGQHITTFTY